MISSGSRGYPYDHDGCHNRNGSLGKIQILILCFRMFELAIFREGEWRYHARYSGGLQSKAHQERLLLCRYLSSHKTQDNEEMYTPLPPSHVPPPMHKYNRDECKSEFLPMHDHMRRSFPIIHVVVTLDHTRGVPLSFEYEGGHQQIR